MAQVGFQSVKTFPSEHNFNWTFGLKGFSYVKVIFLMHKLMRVLYMYSLESFVHSLPINPVATLEGVQLRSTEVHVYMKSGTILVYGFPRETPSRRTILMNQTLLLEFSLPLTSPQTYTQLP